MNSNEYCAHSYIDMTTNGFLFQEVKDRKLTTIPHSHDFYEIIYLVNGNCVHCMNNNDILTYKGQICFIKPCDVHYFKNQSDDLDLICLSVTQSEVLKFSTIYPKLSNLLSFSAPSPTVNLSKSKIDILNSYFMAMNTNQDKSKEIFDYLLSFILQTLLFLDISSSVDINSKTHRRLDKLMMEMTYPENLKIGIEKMVELSNYSRPHLYRMINEYYNTTPNKFITTIRMNYAFQLVISTSYSFEQIANMVGYSSYAHFMKVFKKTFNRSASKVRKEITNYYGSLSIVGVAKHS